MLVTVGVDEFLKRVSEHYEVVVYTASLSKYADPLLDELDKDRVRSYFVLFVLIDCLTSLSSVLIAHIQKTVPRKLRVL